MANTCMTLKTGKTMYWVSVKSWLEGGLQPRAMTRDLEWGVDVRITYPDMKVKKLYVWMDAPIRYISATKQWAKDKGKIGKILARDDDTSLIHFIGKDNIVFHCLIFQQF